MPDGDWLTGWNGLLVAAATLALLALVWHAAVVRRHPPAHRSVTRIALGLSVLVASVAAGGILVGERPREPVEQRGIGVLIWKPDGEVRYGTGNQVTVSMAVEVQDCGRPVAVRLTISPNARFWAKRWESLAAGGRLGVAIPGTIVEDEVHATVTVDGQEAVVSTEQELTSPEPIETDDAVPHDGSTLVTLSVPRWGLTTSSVSLAFTADWTESQSPVLGSCYLDLPALAGPSTALSAASLAGRTADSRTAMSDIKGGKNLVVVSSQVPPLYAYYNHKYEVTRGVASVQLGSNTLDEGATNPAPDATLGGNDAWTCSSTPADTVGIVQTLGEVRDRDVLPDVVVGSGTEDGGFSLSTERVDELLAQNNCATSVVIDEPKTGPRRDLALIMIGALFSFGVELLLSGFRRRDVATA